MLWIKSFHIIAMVAWFSGLFYLPRLMVYHAAATDAISIARFKIMERRLYYGITWPAAILTTIFGTWLLILGWPSYLTQGWMHAKLGCVGLLWIYHGYCGHLVAQFKRDQHTKGSTFYRIYNELPVFLLVAIVVLVVVRP